MDILIIALILGALYYYYITYMNCETIKVLTLECAQKIDKEFPPRCNLSTTQIQLDTFLKGDTEIMNNIRGLRGVVMSEYQKLGIADRYRIFLLTTPVCRSGSPTKEELSPRMNQLIDPSKKLFM